MLMVKSFVWLNGERLEMSLSSASLLVTEIDGESSASLSWHLEFL